MQWTHFGSLEWPHPTSDMSDVGLKWPSPDEMRAGGLELHPSSTAARSPATSSRSRWRARGEATNDFDLRRAAATIGRRGRPGGSNSKRQPIPQVEPNEAARVVPNGTAVASPVRLARHPAARNRYGLDWSTTARSSGSLQQNAWTGGPSGTPSSMKGATFRTTATPTRSAEPLSLSAWSHPSHA